MAQSHLLKKQNGIAVLTIVLIVSAVGIFFLFQVMSIYSKNQNLFVKEKDGLLLNEATMSTFAVMEAALARRMWEPPPNASCLKSENFSVTGEFSNGLKWKVDAFYNAQAKNFELTAEGIYKGQSAKYKKYIKVVDGSDYLIFSAGEKEVILGRLYDEKSATAMIARDRRIFTKGPISFQAALDIPNPKINFGGQVSPFPGTYGTIIQGDRMQFAGGMRYQQYSVPEPQLPDETVSFKNLLSPFSNSWGTPDKTISQWGGGVAVITKDPLLASNLQSQVNTGIGALTKASVASNVYPYALFGGVPPLTAWTGVDSGAYLNDPDKASIFYYTYGAGKLLWYQGEFCLFFEARFADKF
ncbi:MAG: hypothetical protein IPM97_02565 [Bdellovibrionaceae bacterium]|nr:hypothetical protein [Pseudobdellovibrionaceae bacterium]